MSPKGHAVDGTLPKGKHRRASSLLTGVKGACGKMKRELANGPTSPEVPTAAPAKSDTTATQMQDAATENQGVPEDVAAALKQQGVVEFLERLANLPPDKRPPTIVDLLKLERGAGAAQAKAEAEERETDKVIKERTDERDAARTDLNTLRTNLGQLAQGQPFAPQAMVMQKDDTVMQNGGVSPLTGSRNLEGQKMADKLRSCCWSCNICCKSAMCCTCLEGNGGTVDTSTAISLWATTAVSGASAALAVLNAVYGSNPVWRIACGAAQAAIPSFYTFISICNRLWLYKREGKPHL
ncbi:g7702 [Coccomyxa viridis]|uniref:G7702 protein n=1 Tax=Coccomyxa viridis TaxID=1274662 RepID=A0ABP1FYI4_9CHLO